MKVLKWLFLKSKWIHQYIGLFLILFLIWSALSGIILNHPDLFSGISVPGWMVPAQYNTENWNRSSLVELLFLKSDPSTGFAGGKKGVWKTVDGGRTFSRMSEGYSESLYYGKVNDLLLVEEPGNSPQLFAATFGGLWVSDPLQGKWEKVFPPEGHREVKKILKIGNRLVLFTDSSAWSSDGFSRPYRFAENPLKREGETRAERVSLVRLFFDLHGGHAWGLAGRVLFDLMGLLIVFLSLSAFYIWYYPKKWKRRKPDAPGGRKAYGFFYRYHLKLGIWAAVIFLLIGVTAFFMRPPFLAVIAMGDVDRAVYPGAFPDNPWDGKIHNALYLEEKGEVLIEASDGVWAGGSSLNDEFRKTRLPVLVFVMGATVFEADPAGGVLLGSFNGLFHLPGDGRAVDKLSGKTVRFVSPVRPADQMIAGYFRTPAGEEFITAFDQGIIPLNGAPLNGRFSQPPELSRDRRLPLWNYMFELHNGRIFKDLIGGAYILVIPLGAFLFILITLTGIYDWMYTRFKK